MPSLLPPSAHLHGLFPENITMMGRETESDIEKGMLGTMASLLKTDPFTVSVLRILGALQRPWGFVHLFHCCKILLCL